jgi:Flp pilus assembly protein TadB
MLRSRNAEDSLPDALELISVNINSGLTIESALIQAARPEFGELASAMKRAAKEIFSGTTIEKAFKEMSDKIDSLVVERTILLITEGMRKGATLGDILLRISSDLRNESSIRKEINANISMYIILIIIATAIGGPILFGAGSVVALAFTSQNEGITMTTQNQSSLPIFSLFNKNNFEKNPKFTPQEIEIIAVTSIMLTCLFASMIIGVIRYNRETAGARYFVVLLIIGVIIFYVSSFFLKKVIIGA